MREYENNALSVGDYMRIVRELKDLRIVRRGRHVHVIVRVNRLLAAHLPTEHFDSSVGDDLEWRKARWLSAEQIQQCMCDSAV